MPMIDRLVPVPQYSRSNQAGVAWRAGARHSLRAFFACASLGLALLFVGISQAEVPVPPLKAHVTDLTGTLSNGQSEALEQKLAAFEQRKGSQIAVLIVPSTQPETIEQYGIRVAGQWKLGRKGVDDGALLLVAKDDRALRIEVGYGLEGPLPDAIAKRIVSDIIVPRFKQGDFPGGIDAGVDSIIKVVDGEPLPSPATPPTNGGGYGGGDLKLFFLMGLLLVFVGGPGLRAAVGRFPAAAIIGAVTGFFAWWIAASLFAAAVVGIIAFVLSLFSGLQQAMRGGPGGPGGWGGGGWSGGGGGSWGGGGGGFGGGGASGRW